MILRPGAQLGAITTTIEIVVVRAPGHDVELRCDREDMAEGVSIADQEGLATAEDTVLVGKRYVSADGDLEVLCVRSGAGQLSADGTAMEPRSAKPLPASD
jgi:hypothetical protein